MSYTVVGLFHYSGDANLVVSHVRDTQGLAIDDVDVIDRPRTGDMGDVTVYGDERMQQGERLVVVRTLDRHSAEAIAHEMRVTGAAAIDLLPD